MEYRKMSYSDRKNNFEHMMNLPVVRELMMKNEKLMKKNKQLRQMNRILTETIYKHSVKPVAKSAKRNPLRNSNPSTLVSASPSAEQSTSLGPNIKYEIVSEDKEWNEEIDVLNEKMGEIAIKNIATEKTIEKEKAVEEEEEAEETEEVEVEEEEDEEVEEEEVEEEEVEEAEAEAEVEEEVEAEEGEEEEEEVFEIEIKGKTYYTTDAKNGVIYDTDENGDVSLEVGKFQDGKPVMF